VDRIGVGSLKTREGLDGSSPPTWKSGGHCLFPCGLALLYHWCLQKGCVGSVTFLHAHEVERVVVSLIDRVSSSHGLDLMCRGATCSMSSSGLTDWVWCGGLQVCDSFELVIKNHRWPPNLVHKVWWPKKWPPYRVHAVWWPTNNQITRKSGHQTVYTRVGGQKMATIPCTRGLVATCDS